MDLGFIHTGQHYDYALSKQIIEDLGLPLPDLSFELSSSSPGSQIAEIMTRLEGHLNKELDDIVIVQGDTNSVLAAALAAVKSEIPLAHVEAGLRSYDWRMPEEHNRRMVDHISTLLFAPTEESRQNLLTEHVYGSIYVTGNTVIDAVNEHLLIATKKSRILESLKFSEYVLMTLHRAENVDNPISLGKIINGIVESEVPIVFPLHPRTKKRLIEYGYYDLLVSSKHIQIIAPQGYLDFLMLMKHARFIVTDSGGIQEEATTPVLSKHVLVLRRSTEREEAINVGAAKLVPLESSIVNDAIISEWTRRDSMHISYSPFGDGTASEKIVQILKKELVPRAYPIGDTK